MSYQVYLIQNSNGLRYIGVSEDVEKRLLQHNTDQSNFTSGKGPWKLLWTSHPMILSDARKLELKMKRQKGGAGLQTLLDAYGS